MRSRLQRLWHRSLRGLSVGRSVMTEADTVATQAVYARSGVTHVWMVEPRERFVEVLLLADGRYAQIQYAEGDAPARLAPFDAVALDLVGRRSGGR